MLGYAKLGACGLMLILLAGCQSTPDAPLSNNYQGVAPENRVYDKEEVAKTRTSLAAQHIKARQLDIAKNQLEMALKADNRYAPAYDMMGVLLQTEGSNANLVRAEEFFKKAVALDPNLMQARNNYGVYLSLMGKNQEAVQQFEIAGAALGYEGRTRALENLGVVYLKLGNRDAAKSAFMRAIDANTGSIKARTELIDMYLQDNNTVLAKQLLGEINAMYGNTPLLPTILLQSIQIAVAEGNERVKQTQAQKLLSQYPLSDEAKRLKTWLKNPNQPL